MELTSAWRLAASVLLMDEEQWDEALMQFAKAAVTFNVLARCLAVQPHLNQWRTDGDRLQGQLAATGLDQPLLDLERLADGGARDLASRCDPGRSVTWVTPIEGRLAERASASSQDAC